MQTSQLMCNVTKILLVTSKCSAKKKIIILANAKRLKYNFKELKVKNVTQASRLKMFNKLKSLLVNTYMCTVAFCKIKPVCLSFKL